MLLLQAASFLVFGPVWVAYIVLRALYEYFTKKEIEVTEVPEEDIKKAMNIIEAEDGTTTQRLRPGPGW